MTTIKNPSFETESDWTAEVKAAISGCSAGRSTQWASGGSGSMRFFWNGCSGCPPPSYQVGDYIRVKQTINIDSDFSIKFNYKNNRCDNLAVTDNNLYLRVLIDDVVVDSFVTGDGRYNDDRVAARERITPKISGYSGPHTLKIEAYNPVQGVWLYSQCLYIDNLQIVNETLHPTPTPAPAPKKDTMMCSLSIKDKDEMNAISLVVGERYALRAYLYEHSSLGCSNPLKTALAGKTVEFISESLLGTKVLGSVATTSTGYAAIYWTAEGVGSHNIKARFAGDLGYSGSGTQPIEAVVFLERPDEFAVTVSEGSTGTNTIYAFAASRIPFTDYYFISPLYVPQQKSCTGSSCTARLSPDDGLAVGKTYFLQLNRTYADIAVHKSYVYALSGTQSITVGPAGANIVEQAICSLFGVTTDCHQWTAALTADLMTPIADLYVIQKRKSLYTGQPEEPTFWTYFFAGLGMFPFVGGAAKFVGEAKFIEKATELANLGSADKALAGIFDSEHLIRRLPNMEEYQVDNLITMIKAGWDETTLRNYLQGFKLTTFTYDMKLAWEANLGKLLDAAKAEETAATGLKLTRWAYYNGKLLQEYLKGSGVIKPSDVNDILNRAAVKETVHEVFDLVNSFSPEEFSQLLTKLRAGDTYTKVLAEKLDISRYLSSHISSAYAKPVEVNTATAATKALSGGDPEIYADTVGSIVKSNEVAAPVVEQGLKRDLLSELNTVSNDIATSPTTSWRTKASAHIKSKLFQYNQWARSNPFSFLVLGTGVSVSIMAIWYAADNLPFLNYLRQKSAGTAPGDATKRASDYVNSLRSVSINAKTLCDNKDYTNLRAAVTSFGTALNNSIAYRDNSTTALQQESYLDIFNDSIAIYETALSTAQKCLPDKVPIPASGTLTGVSVYEIVDGDTIKARSGSYDFMIRLLGINTPEKPSTALGGKSSLDCTAEGGMVVDKQHYINANTRLIELLDGKTVTLKVNVQRPWDPYERLLAVVISGTTETNLDMLQKGLACYFHRPEWDLTNDVVNHAAYKQARDQAKANRLGIWGLTPTPTPAPSNPTASFTVAPTSPKSGATVMFDASASSPGTGASISKFEWFSNDVSFATGQFASESFTQGSYIIKLVVTNSFGRTDAATKTLNVGAAATPTPAPAPKVGSLTVKAKDAAGNPLSSVVVYIDGIDKSSAPVTVNNLSVGQHTVRLEKSGYMACRYCQGMSCVPPATVKAPCEFTVTITENATVVYEATMLKTFVMNIIGSPANAVVNVDGINR